MARKFLTRRWRKDNHVATSDGQVRVLGPLSWTRTDSSLVFLRSGPDEPWRGPDLSVVGTHVHMSKRGDITVQGPTTRVSTGFAFTKSQVATNGPC